MIHFILYMITGLVINFTLLSMGYGVLTWQWWVIMLGAALMSFLVSDFLGREIE